MTETDFFFEQTILLPLLPLLLLLLLLLIIIIIIIVIFYPVTGQSEIPGEEEETPRRHPSEIL